MALTLCRGGDVQTVVQHASRLPAEEVSKLSEWFPRDTEHPELLFLPALGSVTPRSQSMSSCFLCARGKGRIANLKLSRCTAVTVLCLHWQFYEYPLFY